MLGPHRTAVVMLAVALAGCDASVDPGPAGPRNSPSPFPDGDPACYGAITVGDAPLRRITNAQYANAVHDLFPTLALGDLRAALVPESRLGGFRSNAAIPVSDLEVRSYSDEAMRVAELFEADAATLTGCGAAPADPHACLRAFADRLVTRAYRRHPAPGELDRLLALYDAVRTEEPFAGAASAIVEAVLQSPHFLYRVELFEGAPGSVVLLDDHQVAARLAFFLWDTIPDETLLAAADAGELADADSIDRHARRMLAAPEGQRAIESFHLQWLGVDALVEDAPKDTAAFPTYTPELAALMRDETAHFADEVVRHGDGRWDTLWTGGFTYLRGDLYAHYDLPPGGADWARVELDPTIRPGILTHASFLAMHAHPDQTSPVHRGKAVREAFFCEQLPAPPADVDDTPPDPDPGLTTRERFAVHSEVERCAACHSRMDPIGLALEGYDGFGRRRTMEAGRPVDESGMLTGTDVEGELTGAADLSERIRSSVQARQCLVRNWYRFALDRMETDADTCSMLGAYGAFEASDRNVRELIFALVRSDSFRMARVPERADDTGEVTP